MDLNRYGDPDGPIYRLHGRIDTMRKWWAVRSDGVAWYESALTRAALLIGAGELLWTFGDDEHTQLVVLTDDLLVQCTAESAESEDSEVLAVPRSSLTNLVLLGGITPFAERAERWPGSLTVRLTYGTRAVVEVVVQDFEGSGLSDVWESLVADLTQRG